MKHFVGAYCIKQRKLAKIWRAIARRHQSRCCNVCGYPRHVDNDGETDP